MNYREGRDFIFKSDNSTLHKLWDIYVPLYTQKEVNYIFEYLWYKNSESQYYSTKFLEEMVNSKPDDLDEQQLELFYIILWVYLAWDHTVDDIFVDWEKIKIEHDSIEVDLADKHAEIYSRLIDTWNRYYNLREICKKPLYNYVNNIATKKIIALNPEFTSFEGWVR